MYSKISLYIILLFTLLFSSFVSSFAASIEDIEKALKDYGIAYQKNNYIENNILLDLTPLEKLLEENFSDVELEYEWEVAGKSPQSGPILNILFDTVGNKSIQLNIYTENKDSEIENTSSSNGPSTEARVRVYQSDISIFVYEKSIPLLVSDKIADDTLREFTKQGEELGVFIRILGKYGEDFIDGKKIIESLRDYRVSFPGNSDYLMIWGEKEFLFSVISTFSKNNSLLESPLNLVLVSSYNASILKSYIGNIIAGTSFLKKAFIIDESLISQVLKTPENISLLEQNVSQNEYNYTPISNNAYISPYLFASRFINALSSGGVSVSDIYIILLIPIFLTLIGVIKHMVGLSIMGTTIPIFLTILFVKMGFFVTLGFIGFLFIVNIILSVFLGKYTLLYTPKLALITIINILVFMLFIEGILYFEYGSFITFENMLALVIFFVLSEKLITIITSKEFREYKKSISGTLITSLLCFGVFYIDTLRVFLFAYPEALLILIPFNFFLGRFTGLRVTEYLRFREIGKNIEEE